MHILARKPLHEELFVRLDSGARELRVELRAQPNPQSTYVEQLVVTSFVQLSVDLKDQRKLI